MLAFEWLAGDDPRMAGVSDLRHEVLFEPFGLARLDEWDDLDPASHHLVALRSDRAVGYARLIVDGDAAQVRQVAVASGLQRTGIGTALMREVLAHAGRLHLAEVHLYARLTAEPFYHRLGFVTVSDDPFPYGRTGVPHVRMEYPLG